MTGPEKGFRQIVEIGHAHPSENMYVGKNGRLYPVKIVEGRKAKCYRYLQVPKSQPINDDCP
jgi:hypothetical protein